MEKAIRYAENTLTVVVEVQRRQAAALKDSVQWLEQHELQIREATEKLNALIDIVMKREGK